MNLNGIFFSGFYNEWLIFYYLFFFPQLKWSVGIYMLTVVSELNIIAGKIISFIVHGYGM